MASVTQKTCSNNLLKAAGRVSQDMEKLHVGDTLGRGPSTRRGKNSAMTLSAINVTIRIGTSVFKAQ